MKFRTAKTALITILGTAAAGRYTVEGYEGQSLSADQVLNSLRRVTVYYANGEFGEGTGWIQGPFPHDVKLRVEFLLAADARADLTVLDNPAATALQRQAALAASLEAAERADLLADELIDILWNILMDPRNIDLGLTVGTIANRRVPSIRKDTAQRQGELVILSGSLDYTFAVTEVPTGETGVAGAAIDLTQTQTADISGATTDSAKQGAKAGT